MEISDKLYQTLCDFSLCSMLMQAETVKRG